jgi:uncharacterized protein GlcG (DUF336 family)
VPGLNGDPFLREARRIALEVLKVAEETKHGAVAVSIVDEGGGLVLLYRQENAPYGLVELARSKAWTSSAFHMPSHLAETVCDKLPPSNCRIGWNERFLPLPGGVYVENEKYKIGIGIASLRPERDLKLAKRVVEKLDLAAPKL